MNAIHIIMATTTSANPHNAPNDRIESLARKRKISAVTFLSLLWIDRLHDRLFHFLVFGILLILAGSLLASFEKQRFSVSFIIFGYAFLIETGYLIIRHIVFPVGLVLYLLLCIGYQQKKSS